MDPAQFEHDAFSADRCVALLSQPHPKANALAADLGLFAATTLRLAGPVAQSYLADPADLSYVRIAGGELRIGSLTRHADLLSSVVAGEHFAILRDVRRVIAGRAVRCSATIGGMLCQADPPATAPTQLGDTPAERQLRIQRHLPAPGRAAHPARLTINPPRDSCMRCVPTLRSSHEAVAAGWVSH